MSDLTGSNVLVTGASGFIGQFLVRDLTARGANVICLNRTRSIPSCKTELSDITNLAEVQKLFSKTNIETPIHYVFHLAGQGNIPASLIDPVETFHSNIDGTLNVLESCRSLKNLKNLVIVSTYAASNGTTPYATGKRCAEMLAQSYFKTFGVPITMCRLSNVYGPGQPPIAVIPSIIQQMMASPLLSVGNIHSTRDFLYVEDATSALLAVALNHDSVGTTLNIGTGTATSVQEIIQTLSGLTGFDGEVRTEKQKLRVEDANDGLPDTTPLRGQFAWKPKFDLVAGLSKTISSFRESRG